MQDKNELCRYFWHTEFRRKSGQPTCNDATLPGTKRNYYGFFFYKKYPDHSVRKENTIIWHSLQFETFFFLSYV